jgi:CRP-like cAMP-binding protein
MRKRSLLRVFPGDAGVIEQSQPQKRAARWPILFVEGQTPRGVFIVCSGKVNLSTTSREGKILILKTAGPGEALG